MTYTAVVAKVNTRPHPNADRLLLGTCKGYQVVVGADTQDGELGVFFAADGQLSQEMCDANDLIGYTDPDTGERRGGFFAKNRRVRSQRLRGENSEGYWTSIESLRFTGFDCSSLREGDSFDELNGVPICNKYFTPATLKAQNKRAGNAVRENHLFAKHVDTAQLKREIDRIPEGSIIYITEKLHGTSGRFGYVLEEKNLPHTKWMKFKRFVTRKNPQHVTTSEYKHLLGTRNTILADHNAIGFYGSEEYRWNAVERLWDNLHNGEILYFELVGFTNSGQSIMSQHNTSELKEIKKKYGENITYKYGQPAGTCGLYVYRITRTNEKGNVVELPWSQVKKRCGELGINHVPELQSALVYGGSPVLNRVPPYEPFDKEYLTSLVEFLEEGPSTLDPTHIREGVVVRVEHAETSFLKSKSFQFGVMEGYLKNSDDYVDAEEVA